MPEKQISVLVVDDDAFLSRIYILSLQKAGFAVTVAMNATERAVFDLQVTAPPTWPVTLPVDVDLTVHATTVLETSATDLPVTVRVTR